MSVHTPLTKAILYTSTDTSFGKADNTRFQRRTNLLPLPDS